MELPPLTIKFTPKSLKKGSSLFIFAMQKSARMKLREILKRNTTPTQLKWAVISFGTFLGSRLSPKVQKVQKQLFPETST